jgi:hypothetical protein
MNNPPVSGMIPAPLWLITALHLITLTLHLAAMNFLLGGVIVVLTGRFQRKWENPTVRRFVTLFPSATAATVTLGVAPLLFLQLVYSQQTYSAAIVSGWIWLIIFAAVIVAYYLFYGASFAQKRETAGKGRYLWPALAALLYVSIVYSSVFALAEKPELIRQLYAMSQSGLQLNPNLSDWVLRWLHMVTGAVTVGGFCVGVLGRDDPETIAVGRRAFLLGMGAATLFGTAYLFSLQSILRAFMRTDAIWALTVGIILAGGSLHFFFKRRFAASGLFLFVSIFLMVAVRQEVRILHLQGSFDPNSLPVVSQWIPFLLFLVFFVAALVLVVYMLRLFQSSSDHLHSHHE